MAPSARRTRARVADGGSGGDDAHRFSHGGERARVIDEGHIAPRYERSSPARSGSVVGSTSLRAPRIYASARAWSAPTVVIPARTSRSTRSSGLLLAHPHAVPELQRALVVGPRIRVRVHGVSCQAGLDRRFERPREVVGRVPVVGELGRPGRPAVEPCCGGQRRRKRRVEPGSLAGEQVVIDGLADECVTKGVALASAATSLGTRTWLATASRSGASSCRRPRPRPLQAG